MTLADVDVDASSAAETDAPPGSLSSLFERARATSTTALDGPDDASSLSEAIEACASASRAADAAGASPSTTKNSSETADDLSSRALRWALVPGWEGLLRARRASSSLYRSSSTKLSALLEASEVLKRFLAACRELRVAPAEALATSKEAEDGDDGDDDGEATKRRIPTIGASNPEARRAAKIAAFRAKRELSAKLAKLREKTAEVPTAAASREDEGSDDDEGGEREAVLAELALLCINAADEVLSIKEEASMLRFSVQREKELEAKKERRQQGGGNRRGEADAEEEDERRRKEEAAAVATALRGAFTALSGAPPSSSVSSSSDGVVARPTFAPASVSAAAGALGGLGLGSSTSSSFDRGAAAAAVFRPSHLLPTMSLEEFADKEVAEARARSQREKAAKSKAAAEERARRAGADDGGDDGKTEADGGANLDRLRRMDDWKDDHPFGYGNSKRRPAATGSK